MVIPNNVNANPTMLRGSNQAKTFIWDQRIAIFVTQIWVATQILSPWGGKSWALKTKKAKEEKNKK